jgi:fatty acid desaturase
MSTGGEEGAVSDAAKDYAIPERVNIALLVLLLPATWLLLWAGSHAPWPVALGAALVFALLNNTLFCLMHEAVHGVFSASPQRNRGFGRLAALSFPTAYTIQKIAHLGHHRRNRTDRELYDYYLPGQSKVLRNLWLYAGNLLGFYWACIPFGNLIYLVAPWLYTSAWFVRGPARVLGFEAYVAEIAAHSRLVIWLECLLAGAYQAALVGVLDLSLAGWLLCYWAFALHWSALQYVDHAWSPRDVINGAWNLRVLALSRALALNYHYHLAHHRRPAVPWLYLPALVDAREPQPTFWSIYFSLWGGVRPAPPMVGGSAGDAGTPDKASVVDPLSLALSRGERE